jgi:hypothetical protein
MYVRACVCMFEDRRDPEGAVNVETYVAAADTNCPNMAHRPQMCADMYIFILSKRRLTPEQENVTALSPSSSYIALACAAREQQWLLMLMLL